ncbi:MAG: zinc ribbon domain-containing protein [Eubacterium sp.]|nr:zinc ribbon domain-containing protein [Eubacterium sp.]
MFCPNCGKEIVDESVNCPFCGEVIAAQESAAETAAPEATATAQFGNNYEAAPQQPSSAAWGNPASVATVVDRKSVTKKEFIAKYAPANLKKNIKSAAILCYVCVAISAVAALALLKQPLMLIDVAIYLVLALGMHLGNSKICAYLLLVFSIFECIYSVIQVGTPSGWWLIIA